MFEIARRFVACGERQRTDQLVAASNRAATTSSTPASAASYTALGEGGAQEKIRRELLLRSAIGRAAAAILLTVFLIVGGAKMQQREKSALEAGAALQEEPVSQSRWKATVKKLASDVQRVQIHDVGSGKLLTYKEVVDLWSGSEAFAAFYAATLSSSPYAHFFWECPPTNEKLLLSSTAPFEHVTVRAPGFAPADPSSFSEHFNKCGPSAGATRFSSLGGDATLVAPCQTSAASPELSHYGHLGAFVRLASPEQHAALWQMVGKTLSQTLSERGTALTWLSTEGSGVPWLHVRMDSRPKYYHHQPYRARTQT